MHGRFTPAQAIAIARELEPFAPSWIEEPVPPENLRALAKVARKVNIPVATGERIHNRFEFRELFELQAADVIQPDPSMCGGILETKKIAAWAESYYVLDGGERSSRVGFATSRVGDSQITLNWPSCTSCTCRSSSSGPRMASRFALAKRQPRMSPERSSERASRATRRHSQWKGADLERLISLVVECSKSPELTATTAALATATDHQRPVSKRCRQSWR
jgi:hypothetical protein